MHKSFNDTFDIITDFVAAGSFADLRKNVIYYERKNYAQLIRTTDLKNGLLSNPVFIDEKAYKFLWRVNLTSEGIICPNIGANIGEVYYYSKEMFYHDNNALGPNAILLKSYTNNNYYLYSYMQSKKYLNQLFSMVGASGQPKFNKTELKKIKINIHKIDTQKFIGDLFRKIDDRINTQKKIIEEYKLLKKAICDDYRKQNCTKCKIKDLALIGRGRVINSTEISHQKNPKYPVYSSQTLNNGIMGYLDGYDFDGEYITWTTDGANAGTVFYHNEKFNCTNVCGTIKVTNKMINPFYLSLILQYECKKYVSLNLANPKLMNNTMASIEVKVPNLDYQKRIINSVKILDEKILNEEKVLQLYQSQKDYLLNHMFI